MTHAQVPRFFKNREICASGFFCASLKPQSENASLANPLIDSGLVLRASCDFSMDTTAAAYQGLPKIDRAFYDGIRTTEARNLVQSFVIPIRTGQAWKVRRPPSNISDP